MSRPHSFGLLLAVCFAATSSSAMAQLNPYPVPAPIPGAGGVTAPGRLANRVPLPTPVPDPGVFKTPVTVPAPAPPATNPAVAPRTASPAPFANSPGPVANMPAPQVHNTPAPNMAGGAVSCGTGAAGCGSGGCATGGGSSGGCATGGCATGGCGGHSGSCGKSCNYYPLFSDLEPFGCGHGRGGGMLSRYFKSVFGARTNFCGDSSPQASGPMAGCGSAGSACGGSGCALTGSNGCGLFGKSCGVGGLGSCLNGSMFGNCGSGGLFGNCSLGKGGCGTGGLGSCLGNGSCLAGKGLFGNCGAGGGGLSGSCLSGLAGGAGGLGGACGFASLSGKLAYPDAGWAPPASVPVIRNNAQYTNWWPEQWYGSAGFNATTYPMVFMPTDTTQLGFGYMQVPMWQRTTANYPPIPDAGQYHTRTAPVPSPYGYPKVYQPVAIPHHAGVRNRTGWHASASQPQSKEQYVAMQRARQYQARQAEQARQYQAMRYRQAQMYQASQQRSAANIRPVSSSSPR
jgi:hypothetical protein